MPSDEVVHLETFVPLAPCYLTSVQAYRRPFVWRTRHQRWCPSSCNNCCLGWIKVRWRIRIIIIFISPTGAVAKYCNEYVCVCVCVSVCPSARIYPEPHARSLPFLVHVAYGRGSVLIRRRCDTLCTFGFLDGIRFLCTRPYSGMNFATNDRFRLNLLLYRKVKQNSIYY